MTMPSKQPGRYDAVVVGSGPNGLAAAITVARAGRSVLVLEAADEPGGGARSQELTLSGFVHDVCSAVHPLAIASPFLSQLPLDQHGLEWIHSPSALAHPLDDGSAVLLDESPRKTADGLGEDALAYMDLFEPLARDWSELAHETMGPLAHFPRHPLLLARFGRNALLPAAKLARRRFGGKRARALFAGVAAHSALSLDAWGSSSIGLMLTTAAHVRGWPIPRGGSRSIANAMVSYLKSLGGELRTGVRVRSLRELPSSRLVFLDITPKQFLELATEELPASYRNALARYRYGPGVFKMDWALSAPIPWKSRACLRAATVHLGGTLEEIALSENITSWSELPQKPYVLLAQPSLFDPSRAPAGHHTAWAYCHVPHDCNVDRSAAMEAQIERFAPGFRDLILARSALFPKDLEARNPNLVGGDISGGSVDLRQLLFRPLPQLNPYATALPGVYLCSASTPPGPGVHGMCGHLAARSALQSKAFTRGFDRP